MGQQGACTAPEVAEVAEVEVDVIEEESPVSRLKFRLLRSADPFPLLSPPTSGCEEEEGEAVEETEGPTSSPKSPALERGEDRDRFRARDLLSSLLLWPKPKPQEDETHLLLLVLLLVPVLALLMLLATVAEERVGVVARKPIPLMFREYVCILKQTSPD